MNNQYLNKFYRVEGNKLTGNCYFKEFRLDDTPEMRDKLDKMFEDIIGGIDKQIVETMEILNPTEKTKSSYNPPTAKNWVSISTFYPEHKENYDKGYEDAKNKREYNEPYPNESPYGYMDEYNFEYYRGYYDFEEEVKPQ